MDLLTKLRSQLEEGSLESEHILQAADNEGRELTEQEQLTIKQNSIEFTKLTEEIALREQVASQRTFSTGSQGRRSDPQQPDRGAAPARRDDDEGGGRQRFQAARGGDDGGNRRVFPSVRDRANDGRGGFQSMGEYFLAVRQAAIPGARPDQRLTGVRMDTSTNFSNETGGSDGGFLVPPDIRTNLVSRILGEDSLLARCDQITTNSNSVTLPVDVDEVWNDNTGIYARWENEGGIKPESKISLEQMNIRLNKLVALVPVSDELLEDAPAIDGYIRTKAPDKINFKVSRSIIAGTGNGQPLGILKSGARITVAAGAAPSGSIQFAHVAAMWGRMYGPWRSRAVWLVNPELDAQLMTMFFSAAPVASTPATPIPVYLPANSVNDSPYATLFGRPVIPTQACEPLGTEGDIIFADLSQYLTLVKGGAIKTDVSIHVYFVQDLTAFRFVLRVGGMPWIPAPYQPRTGSFTTSPFVTLQSR